MVPSARVHAAAERPVLNFSAPDPLAHLSNDPDDSDLLD
jgi:hypothetical protein